MIRPRASIAGLMGVVLVSAVGVAALKAATPIWSSVVLTSSLGLMGLAVLGASFRSGAKRAFWAGVAVMGWGYLTLAFGPWFATEIEPKLATTKALTVMHEKLHPGPVQTSAIIAATGNIAYSTVAQAVNTVQAQGLQKISVTTSSPQPGGTSAPMTFLLTTTPTPASSQEDFLRIGHAFFALLAALIGGLMARWFAKRPAPAAEVAS